MKLYYQSNMRLAVILKDNRWCQMQGSLKQVNNNYLSLCAGSNFPRSSKVGSRP
uniref:Uncharacterized protein n=1 Tax=Arundo donax TaxID=35708 RepID=A0A0A8Z8Z3_ARUDO